VDANYKEDIMPSNPKFFAWLFGYERDGQGDLKYMVEYSSLQSPSRSGKAGLSISVPVNEKKMTDDLKDALATHLSTKYAPDTFTDRDIVGLAV
jgi:hypothetical protein